MTVVIACGLLIAVGLTAGWRWGGLQFQPPPAAEAPADVARRYVWYLAVATVAGLGAGVLVAGAGGRLVMRLLAVTSPDAVQSRVTEAEEIVGEITVGGTVGFIVFTGLFFGLATGVLYLLVRRWLPPGRLGGLAFGALLLVVAGTRIEPLRTDNPDFDIVGPSWVSLLAFGVLVVSTAWSLPRSLPATQPRFRSWRGSGGRSLATRCCSCCPPFSRCSSSRWLV